jgi:hypothetical protein
LIIPTFNILSCADEIANVELCAIDKNLNLNHIKSMYSLEITELYAFRHHQLQALNVRCAAVSRKLWLHDVFSLLTAYAQTVFGV